MKEPMVRINVLLAAISLPAVYQFSHLIIYLFVAGRKPKVPTDWEPKVSAILFI